MNQKYWCTNWSMRSTCAVLMKTIKVELIPSRDQITSQKANKNKTRELQKKCEKLGEKIMDFCRAGKVKTWQD